MSEKVYTVNEIMSILKISKATAYKFIKDNPPFKVLSICDGYRINKESFDEWLNNDIDMSEKECYNDAAKR